MEKNMFRRFLATYVVILLIPCLALLFLYHYSSLQLEEKILRSELAMLDQTKIFLDSKLLKLSSHVRHNLQDSALGRFLYIRDPLSLEHVMQVRETKSKLEAQYSDEDIILDWFALFDETSFVLGPKASYRMDRFYGYYYTYGDLSYEAWREDKFRGYHGGDLSPMAPSVLENRQVNVLEYTASFPLTRSRKAVITALLDGDLLNRYLSAQDGGERTVFLFREGEEGPTLLLSTGGPPPEGLGAGWGDRETRRVRLEEGLMLVSSVRSTDTGLLYVSMVSGELSLRELEEFKRLILLLGIAVMGLTLAVSLRFAGANTKPIRSLLDENTALSDTVARQMPLLHSSFLEKLFLGSYHDEGEIAENMAWLSMEGGGERFLAAVIRVDVSGLTVQALNDEMVTAISRIKLLMAGEDYSGPPGYACLLGKNDIAMLFSWGTEDEEALRRSAREALALFSRQLASQEKHIGVGGVCRSRSGLAASYAEAVQTIDYFALHQSDDVLHGVEEIPRLEHSYYYPPDTNLRLAGLLKDGDGTGVGDLLRALYTENIVKRDLSPAVLEIFINSLWVVVLELEGSGLLSDPATRRDVGEAVAGFSAMTSLEKLQTCMRLYGEIGDSIARQRSLETDRKAKEILSFVKQGYKNQDLSLKLLTERFNISESHLSVSFKEWTGENFHSHLQNLRIREAASLLAGTERTMQDIATEVGYSSYNTFARAFKRIMGVSATSYRDKHREANG